MNLFDLINREMERLCADRDYWLNTMLGKNSIHLNDTNFRHAQDQYKLLKEEINNRRKLIFDQFQDYDKKIQEIIAEKALTGELDEKPN